LYRSTDGGSTFSLRSNSPNILGYDTNGGSGSQAWYDLVAIGDLNDADHIIVGGINLWESFDGGSTWSIVSHWVGSGGNPAVHADQHVLEWNPHTGHLFAGHDGGLHYTTDGGASFTEISSGLGISQIYKIGQSALNSDLTIAGFQDNGTALIDNGVWRTEIGGDGMECIVDYTDNQVMYGALYYGDMRRSTNGGNNFSTIAKNGTNGINESGAWVTPYKLHPTNPDAMFIGYNNLWYSTNCKSAASNTVTWTKISNLSTGATIRDIGIAPSDPNTIYFSRSSGSNFYRSTNALGGSPTWTDLEASLPASGYPRDIEIHHSDPQTLWIALGNNIYKSTNGGDAWTDVSGTLPNISLNTIALIPDDPEDAIYVGMDVGVYYKDNTISDWVYYGDFLPNTEVLELEIYYEEDCPSKSKLMAATYGRGLWESPLYYSGNESPVACFEASRTEGCVGSEISFTDFTAYNPTSWTWTITPTTHSYEGGTSSNAQNPLVKFNALGLYTVTLTATNANGSDQVIKTDYININETAYTLPYNEDFESMTSCGTSSDCGATACSLGNGWVNLENGSEDDIDFRVDSGGTPSANTGPTTDYNPGTPIGNYIYTEASSCSGRSAVLVSPCIDLAGSSAPELNFAYHMSGGNMGTLSLDILVDGAWQEDFITPISGDQGVLWKTMNVSLSQHAGKMINLRFRAITGNGYQSDITIDDISIVDDGNCMVNNAFDSGSGSLRHCVENAEDGQMITFDPSIQNTEIVLLSGAIAVDNTIDIMSIEANNIGISAAGMSRALDIAAGKNVHIMGLIIRAGTASSGRGIRNMGTLTLENVDIYDNNAMAGTGSLIENTGNITILGDCNFLIDQGN
jgi:PKD repeat protein